MTAKKKNLTGYELFDKKFLTKFNKEVTDEDIHSDSKKYITDDVILFIEFAYKEGIKEGERQRAVREEEIYA